MRVPPAQLIIAAGENLTDVYTVIRDKDPAVHFTQLIKILGSVIFVMIRLH